MTPPGPTGISLTQRDYTWDSATGALTTLKLGLAHYAHVDALGNVIAIRIPVPR